jgi:hypothetical protein
MGLNKYVDGFNGEPIRKLQFVWLSALQDLKCATSTMLVVINS